MSFWLRTRWEIRHMVSPHISINFLENNLFVHFIFIVQNNFFNNVLPVYTIYKYLYSRGFPLWCLMNCVEMSSCFICKSINLFWVKFCFCSNAFSKHHWGTGVLSLGPLPIPVFLIIYPNFGLGLFTKFKERNEFSSLSRNTTTF